MPRRSAARLLGDFAGLPRAVWLLAAARCVNTFGFSIVMPFLAHHLTARAGASLTTVGAIYGVAGALGAVGQLVGGELADRYGRRRVMVASLVLRALVLGAFGLAILDGASVRGLGALVVANAIVRSAFEPASQSLAALHAGPGRRTAAFGLQRVGVNLGWALGPAVGGLFAARWFGPMFFVAGGVLLVAALGCSLVAEARTSEPRPRLANATGRLRLIDLSSLPRPRRLLAFLAVTLVMSLLTTQLFSTMSVYAMARLAIPERRFGLLYTINGVLVVALQAPVVALSRRIGTRRALLVGPLAYAVGYAAIGLARDLPTLGIAVALVTLGELVTEPSETVAAMALGDPSRPGRTLGLYGLVTSLGNSLGPAVGGVLYDRLPSRPRLLWSVIASLGLVGAAGYQSLGDALEAADEPVTRPRESEPRRKAA